MKRNIVGSYYRSMVDNRYLYQAASDCSGISYQVNKEYGVGSIRRLDLGDGLDVSCWDTVSVERLWLDNLQSNQEVLEIIYCHGGQMTVQIGDDQELVLAEDDVLFYYHQQALPAVVINTRMYSGVSIHVHRQYVQQLLGTACADRFNGQWQDNISTMLANKPMVVRRAPLALQLTARKLQAACWNDMKTYLAFQAKIMEFLSSCMQNEARTDPAGTLTQADREIVYKAQQYLLEHLAEPPSIKKLAWICQTNSDKLQKDFKSVYHTTLYSYLRAKRLEKSQQLLKHSADSIAAIANQIGYTNPSKFASAFREYTGMTPSEYKKTD